MYNTLIYNGEKNIFCILNTTNFYVWNIVYLTISLFNPSLRYQRPGYLRSRNFILSVFELYILILILNNESVTVIVINKLNHYHLVQFLITFIYNMYTPWMS